MATLRVVVLGYGTVARAVSWLLAELGPRLQAERGASFSFAGALTRGHGGWLHPTGLSAAELHASNWPGGPVPAGARRFNGSAFELIAACEANALLELTPLSPMDGEPARSYLEYALRHGLDAVTANKGPIAHSLRPLRALAQERGRQLRFESTVMDGTPLFNLRERCLPGTRILRARGVLNSTSSHVSDRLGRGDTLEEAVHDAQRLGIAETDPSYDLDGWDSAVKAAVLANVLLEADIRPHHVLRQGCSGPGMREAVATAPPGARVRQLVEIARQPEGAVTASVQVTPLEPGSILASLRGMETAIILTTDTMQDLTIVEGEGGPGQTAFGVIADLVEIATSRARST